MNHRFWVKREIRSGVDPRPTFKILFSGKETGPRVKKNLIKIMPFLDLGAFSL